jgi:hypothetical protein
MRIIIIIILFVGPWPLISIHLVLHTVGLLGRGCASRTTATHTEDSANTE